MSRVNQLVGGSAETCSLRVSSGARSGSGKEWALTQSDESLLLGHAGTSQLIEKRLRGVSAFLMPWEVIARLCLLHPGQRLTLV